MPHDKETSTTPLVEQIKSFEVIPGERDLIEQIITYAGYEFIVTTNDGNTLQGSNGSIVKAYDHYHMKLVVPTPNSKRMNTQRIPLGQIFKIELTPRAELQRRISENAHKLIVIQHQHEGKVETTKGTLMGYSRIDILDHEVCLATEEKLISIKLSEILHLDFEDENPHIVNFLDEGEISSTTSEEEEEPPKQITSPQPKPTRMSEQIISKTITSPKPATATRTQQGWSLPSPKTETYADKVKMSKKPLDVKFNLTPLGFTTQHQKERQRKTEWKRSLFKLIKMEDDETETELTWYNTKQLIQGTLMQIDMYITSTDMDNNKDRIKLITNDDQEAFNTIWELAQNTTKKLNEKKKTWIQALEQAIEKEFTIQTDDWPDLTRAWDKSLRDVGIRVPIQTLREITPWNLDERIVNKPDHLDELWNVALRYAKSQEETTQQTDWEKHINEEFTKEVNRATRQNDQLNFENAAVKAFQRVGIFINPDWLFNYTITGNTIQNIVELETFGIRSKGQSNKRNESKKRIG
jgi:hypothetical protein